MMKAHRIATCWDYHHGQATRILVGGFPPVAGSTMAEKQANFEKDLSGLRASLCKEPRGHRNMLGAIVTEPVTDGSLMGVLFTSPDGYFDMCGDSTFSVGSYLIDSGLVSVPGGDGEAQVSIDTVAGRVDLLLKVVGDELVSTTIGNVDSYYLGTRSFDIEGHGLVTAELGYGGLVFAFVPSTALGLGTLLFANLTGDEQRTVIDAGTRFLKAARASDGEPAVDLVVITEPLPNNEGSRVANFYAPGTMGRTPSGTGLSARLAIEYATGRLEIGQPFAQESALGLRFDGKITQVGESGDRVDARVSPALMTRSYLMGISQMVFQTEDPFVDGFSVFG